MYSSGRLVRTHSEKENDWNRYSQQPKQNPATHKSPADCDVKSSPGYAYRMRPYVRRRANRGRPAPTAARPPKSKLAADHLGSLAHIHVDTDENGVVWLSGSAHNQEAVDQAMSIARDTEGVQDVKSAVRIRHDD